MKVEGNIVQKEDVFLTKGDKIELVSKIESAKRDIIKWMFIFWIGQLAATSGILFVFFNWCYKK